MCVVASESLTAGLDLLFLAASDISKVGLFGCLIPLVTSGIPSKALSMLVVCSHLGFSVRRRTLPTCWVSLNGNAMQGAPSGSCQACQYLLHFGPLSSRQTRAIMSSVSVGLCQRSLLGARIGINSTPTSTLSSCAGRIRLARKSSLSYSGQRSPTYRSTQISSHLRRINLPDTWRGRRAARKARTFWIKEFPSPGNNAPLMQNPKPKEPLLLFIDDRPTAEATTIRPNAIVFAQRDQLGQKLWKIAHSIPWSDKSRWITWPVYFVVGLYSLLFTLWYFCRERVPITGRLQFQIHELSSPPPRGKPLKIFYDEDVQKVLLADDDPRVMRVRSILNRILVASGQEHLEWKLTVLDCPGKLFGLSRGMALMHYRPR